MIEYWKAGQRRLAREARGRLAEMWRAVRDGYLSGEVALGRAKGDDLPAYVRALQDRSQPAKGIAQLMADHPYAVSSQAPRVMEH